jgi:hypothetical protein
VEQELQGGKVVGQKYTALSITLTTDESKATEAQYLPPLKRVTVYADTVTILGRINLPGTKIRIVARQLLCAAGYDQCVINTSGLQNQASLVANAKQAQGGSGGTVFGASGGKGAHGMRAACQLLLQMSQRRRPFPTVAAPHHPCCNRPQASTASAARMEATSIS